MANALKEIEHIQWLCDHNDITIGEYKELVKPWEDVEPVVRCKDCTHYDGRYCITAEKTVPRHSEWFCADGEREEK